MSASNPHERASDEEAFKYNIIAQQAEIKTKYDLMYDMVKAEVREIKNRLDKTDSKYEELKESLNKKYDTLKEVIAGGLSGPGVLEQNRNLVKDLAKLGSLISLVGFILWKIVSPLYDAWVSKWASQKITASESQQPEAKSSRIVRKPISIKETKKD